MALGTSSPSATTDSTSGKVTSYAGDELYVRVNADGSPGTANMIDSVEIHTRGGGDKPANIIPIVHLLLLCD
jgi:hypothetical protein